MQGPIGIFDSGYGGLTILEAIRRELPWYDYLYLGDNARAPYGSRSFDVVYEFTRQAVERLFAMGCPLVILGCNTASAKALRTIQQRDLPRLDPTRRVLGVIRPTAEVIGTLTSSRHVGVLATEGTIKSESYRLEIAKLFPDITVTGQPCPFWAQLVENNELTTPGADYFVQKPIDRLMAADPLIDAVILGCTHYPLLIPTIRRFLPAGVRIVSQGSYVATSLRDYLTRHADLEARLSRRSVADLEARLSRRSVAAEASCGTSIAPPADSPVMPRGTTRYLTTERSDRFKEQAQLFLHETIDSVESIVLG